MEENKVDEGTVIAEGVEEDGSVDHLAPIKEAVKGVGIEMPDLVATGDLSVESKEEVEDKPKETTKKDVPLPEMGAKFMLNGHEYKVIYINAGQHRFSCEPCKGVY